MSLKEQNTQNENKKILLITEDPAIEVEGHIYSNNSVNHFWSELLGLFDKAYFSMPLRTQKTCNCLFPHKLNIDDNTTLSPRKFYHYKLEALKNPIKYLLNSYSLIKDILRADVVLYRLPSVFFPVLLPVLILFRKRKRIVLFIGGDFYGRNTKNSLKPKQIIKNIIVSSYDHLEKKGSQYFKTLANGRQLADKYSAELFDLSLIPSHKLKHSTKEIKDGSVRILYAGRLDKNKSVVTLLSAINLLEEHFKNRIKLFVVGSGPEEQNLREYTKSVGIDHLVSFEGYVPFGPRLERYFNESHIFVLPSLSEGTTKVIFEAMAFGLAIIATNVGGIPYVTENGKCACLVPPGSPQNIKEAIVKVISDEKLRSDLIRNGTRIASNNTMEKKLAHIERLLKE